MSEECGCFSDKQRIEVLESQIEVLLRDNSTQKSRIEKQQELLDEVNKNLKRVWDFVNKFRDEFDRMWDS